MLALEYKKRMIVKFQTILVLGIGRKMIDLKIFISRAKLIAGDADIDEAFKSMHQSIIMIIKTLLVKTGLLLKQ